MEKVRHWFHKLSTLRTNQWLEISAWIASFIFFFINYKYVSYPDEFINILGGAHILQGRPPYSGFFDHHLPLAWYLAAVYLLLSFKSFILFRFWWTLTTFVGFVLLGRWLKRNYQEYYRPYLAFIITYPLAAVYFWFHLYLADSLAVFFFSLVFWILMVQTLTKRIHMQAILWSSVLTFCLIFSSLTFLYLSAFLYLWQLYLIGKNKPSLIKWVTWCVVPYAIFLVSLLITGALKDFFISNFIYNTKLYISIPNYTRGAHFNPLKFMLTIIYNFSGSYLTLLSKIKHLDLYLPIGTLGGLGTLALLIILLIYRLPAGILFFFVLTLSAPRSSIQDYKETDYQASLFIVLGLISALLVVQFLRRLKLEESLWRDLKRVTQLLLTIFFIFTVIFLVSNSYTKAFKRYTQVIPSALDYSYTSQFIDQMVDTGEYYWIGPYEPQEQFFVTRGRTPGKYPSLLPQFREDDYFKQGFLSQFEQNRPKIIIFRHEASIFGTPALEFGKFFLDWMNGKYTAVEHIKGVEVLKTPSDFTLSTDLYILNTDQENILNRLRSFGYIR